ncbi:translation initiation factor SUI1 [Polychytrium aggregatum]|uniref:translation initiation factor SUI1 n=1 Tax=Polychytrium aggregatum TaxID=110093 RepID=UPI0022FE668C|nr:translation initiation factor SUI1 [Polychytrium aggregatum]KAI9202207.1 translation initiation factor SUI1 [Polychytrium aggregatum]
MHARDPAFAVQQAPDAGCGLAHINVRQNTSADMSDTEEQTTWPPTRVIENIVYCQVCSLPPEYCEFSGSIDKCKAWLQSNHPDLYDKIWAESVATVDDPDAAKKQKKEEAKAERAEKLKQSAKVTIKRVERTKRKCVIVVTGLESFNIDLKKAAKIFASKFACGSSVTKNAAGQDEIVVQGDVQDDLFELLLEKYPEITEDQVELTEDQKKKK